MFTDFFLFCSDYTSLTNFTHPKSTVNPFLQTSYFPTSLLLGAIFMLPLQNYLPGNFFQDFSNLPADYCYPMGYQKSAFHCHSISLRLMYCTFLLQQKPVTFARKSVLRIILPQLCPQWIVRMRLSKKIQLLTK